MKRKRLVVLGATGSIGESAAKVARDIPERVEIVGIAANSKARELAAQANELRPGAVCIVDETKLDELRTNLNYKPEIFWGEAGLREIASKVASDMVLIAIVGTGGLRPALAAIEAGKDLAVASKEILVMAGEIVMRESREKGVHVLPVDSEHNAIFQCLEGRVMQQSQRPTSNAQRPTPNAQCRQFSVRCVRCSPHYSHSIRWPVPRNARRRVFEYHGRTSPEASDLEYGAEDHDRFGHLI